MILLSSFHKIKSFNIFSQYKNEFILLDKNLKKKEQILDKYNVEIHAIHYPELIYFLIRELKPQSVIETGVWLGLSRNTYCQQE